MKKKGSAIKAPKFCHFSTFSSINSHNLKNISQIKKNASLCFSTFNFAVWDTILSYFERFFMKWNFQIQVFLHFISPMTSIEDPFLTVPMNEPSSGLGKGAVGKSGSGFFCSATITWIDKSNLWLSILYLMYDMSYVHIYK